MNDKFDIQQHRDKIPEITKKIAIEVHEFLTGLIKLEVAIFSDLPSQKALYGNVLDLIDAIYIISGTKDERLLEKAVLIKTKNLQGIIESFLETIKK